MYTPQHDVKCSTKSVLLVLVSVRWDLTHTKMINLENFKWFQFYYCQLNVCELILRIFEGYLWKGSAYTHPVVLANVFIEEEKKKSF